MSMDPIIWAMKDAPIADPRPTIPTQAKRCLSARWGQVNGRRWRLPGYPNADLRLLKTLKTATVASTPLAIW